MQNALSTVFGTWGPVFITVAMLLFAFTTLLGNLYYADNVLAYLNGKKKPGRKFMIVFHIAASVVVFFGALIPMDAAWALADILMGGMTFINLPACMALSGIAIHTLRDYEKQRRAGLNPSFKAADIGLDPSGLDYWV